MENRCRLKQLKASDINDTQMPIFGKEKMTVMKFREPSHLQTEPIEAIVIMTVTASDGTFLLPSQSYGAKLRVTILVAS